MIDQIKEALEKATNKGKWIFNDNEIVASNNLKCGIGGFLTDEDNQLAVNLPIWIRYLMVELEKAQKSNERLQKIADAKYISLNKGDEEARWTMQERNIELEEENAVMKKALEEIADYAGSLTGEDAHEMKIIASGALSTLSQPKEEAK